MSPTQAILIRLTRLTDTSLIVHWFTEDHGLVKTVAKGARRDRPAGVNLDIGQGAQTPSADWSLRDWP